MEASNGLNPQKRLLPEAFDKADEFLDRVLELGRFDNMVLISMRPEDFYTLWNAWLCYGAQGRYASHVSERITHAARRYIEKYEGWSEKLSR